MRPNLPPLIVIVLIIVVTAAFAVAQQSAQQPVIANARNAKLVTLAGTPDCITYSVVHGDTKGANSVTLVNFANGCTAPLHWHSATEQLTSISGTIQLQMQGEQPQTVDAGAYVYTPAHHAHQLACASGCTFYRALDGPADIHYIDAAGSEISAEKALAPFGEHPVPAVAQK